MVGISVFSGPPTTTTLVWGKGFDPYATIDIYFDQTDDLAMVVTDGSGQFGIGVPGPGATGVAIVVPKEALPGIHWITGTERYGIRSAQTQFMVRTDWAQFRFDPNQRASNSYENVLGPGNVSSISLHWSYPGRFDSVVIANGFVYGASGNDLYAFNAATGGLRWKNHVSSRDADSKLTVDQGVLYVLVGTELYGLDVSTGNTLWTYDTGYAGLSVTVSKGLIYVGCHGSFGDKLCALNATTRELQWVGQTSFRGVKYGPSVANGVVYVTESGSVWALNAANGYYLWNYYVDKVFDITGWPALGNGAVYVAGAGVVYAVSTATGQLIWSYPLSTENAVAVAGGLVYALDYQTGDVVTLNAVTGKKMWNANFGDCSQYPLLLPIVANGVLYAGATVGCDTPIGHLYALNANTGELLWNEVTGGVRAATVANGVLYVGAESALYAFDLSNSLSPDKLNPPQRPEPALLVPNYGLTPSGITSSSSLQPE